MKHSFGGAWTQIKLDKLRRYLVAFNTALKATKFRRVYIDAFAGTGACEIRSGEETVETIAGSARLAIEVSPAFDEIHLVDLNKDHVTELRALAAQANVTVTVHHNDANVALHKLMQSYSWKGTRRVLVLNSAPPSYTTSRDTIRREERPRRISGPICWSLGFFSNSRPNLKKKVQGLIGGNPMVCLSASRLRLALLCPS
jgi:hypothetical protein